MFLFFLLHGFFLSAFALPLSQRSAPISPCKVTGNFPTVTRVLLGKIPPQSTRQSYIYDSHVFHYVVSGGLTYLCMSDEQGSHRIPFSFLAKIEDLFGAKYGTQGLTAIAFSMNDEFSHILKKEMDYFNNNPEADAVSKVKGQIEDVKNVMVENIEKVR